MDVTVDCPECDEPVSDADRQCEACGGDVRARRGGTVDSVAPAAEPCQRCGAPAPTGVAAEYCTQCGLRRRDGSDRVDTDLGSIGGVSDRGLVHARNEDAMALGLRSPVGAAAVLCDGVSTVRTPELAARAAVEAALDVLLAEDGGPTGGGEPGGGATSNAAIRRAAAAGDRLVRRAVGAAAAAVDALGEIGDRDAPSCTLVCAQVDYPAGAGRAPVITVGWVGDSRAYWLAEPGGAEPSQLLTTDHSWATVMIESGRLDRQTALADRRAHAITRWLGQGGQPEPELLSWRPEGPGVLLLCSDGLWNYLPGADELAAALPPPELGASPVLIARHLTELALDAGGRDNITVIVIPVSMDR